jgi:hypothetical protein
VGSEVASCASGQVSIVHNRLVDSRRSMEMASVNPPFLKAIEPCVLVTARASGSSRSLLRILPIIHRRLVKYERPLNPLTNRNR